LIGTTDRDQAENAPIAASEEEIAYLCEGASRYFAQSINPGDVVWTYSGVRPLIDDGSGKPEAATRGYRLELSDPAKGAPLLSVYGGKITTYRHLAEEAVDLLAPRLTALSGKTWTTSQPLPGGDFPVGALDVLMASLAAAYPFLGEADVDRITRAYGTHARTWLGEAQGWQALGRNFGAGLTTAEVDYLRTHEWAVSAEDVLWRRTKLGLRLSKPEQAALAEYLGT
ncbi:glycerol-3-phosphate dehydrogenase C-terminal domain-containing protein, partial [Novosphingobium sp.]|uniref:glycerol-3-phosphate dehydrogenase C-terminal domain-containing protein n=1 Tax=Novosphingobium sp. TaxID=1874826 RepID=UPI00286B7B66